MTQYNPAFAVTGPVLADLRSDTVTRPSAAMRAAMAEADVGDDVYGDDPTVNKLEATLAERLGKDAGLFVPSGTQSNLLAMMTHCARGEQVISGDSYHVIRYEAAGASVLGGVALHALPVTADGGLEPAAIGAAVINGDSHHPISRLLSLENTTYGRAVPFNRVAETATAGRDLGLSLHLDGARYFNAVAALACSERHLSDLFDTVSICLSKGLGAPVGSVLLGPTDFVARARRTRKMLGGGMRQAGILAAAGLHALTHNLARLSQDHQRAEILADHLRKLDLGEVTQATNMVFLTPHEGVDLGALAAKGIRLSAPSPACRMVLHRDIDDDALSHILGAFSDLVVAR